MNLQSKQEVNFLFELLTEGTYEADIALVNSIGQDVLDALRDEGYFVQSVAPPGGAPRGGEILVQFVTFVTNVVVSVWVNRDAILADVAALIE
ncbi:MAG TPA: hypothetical protein VH593_24930, partial [Ktedonobacteraceae bacterium]